MCWRAVSGTLHRWFSSEEPVTGLELSAGAARKRVQASLERLNDGEREPDHDEDDAQNGGATGAASRG